MTAAKTIVGTCARPGRTFKALATEAAGPASGLRVLLIIGGLYALTSAALAAAGALVAVPPLLVLSPENYYLLQAVFIVPVLLLAWLAAGGTAFLLTRRRGQGTYEGLLAALAPALAVPLLVVWFFASALAVFLAMGGKQEEIMDLTASPGIEQAVAMGFPILAAAWLVFLTVKAVRAARKVGWARACAAGLAASLVLLGGLAVFLR
jgi:hypothetical protein